MSFYDELRWRGLVYETTEELPRQLDSDQLTCYIGFDPTAKSLHVGSLLPAMTLARMQRRGHHPIALVGGGTGLIGDPSGKTTERRLLTAEQVAANLVGIRGQLEPFLDFTAKSNPARMVDNAEWLTTVRAVDFFRDVGKHVTVNYMLAKESVKRRLAGEEGISFTEFTYLLLQAYDFLVLFDRYGCRVQMGGSDQWGNITAGIDLIRKLRGERAQGLVFPLITTASGTKFGKTEAGTVWLDPELTSPYRFYQFWLNAADDDVVGYLKLLTFLERGEIEELAAALAAAPQERQAQRRLAREVTRLVHGEDAVARAERSAQVLFGSEITELSADELLDVFADVPASEQVRSELLDAPLVQVLAATDLAQSKGEARRLIRGGGIYVNNVRVGDETARVAAGDLVGGRLLLLRKGARRYHLVRAVEG